ncbi:hypothetical protein [Stenotrophomonas sp. 24(2023)]|uniref:hypothetical protein n=1 Tax=Stenotrophomonas sp. 24(2023) TaxID=3068324 RepID=UPI0027E014D8|nr:hypothetical protein [Stenotrophomonas sp. 24(2023)]WMJ69429.1 hypothetical protein Q9R17_19995 [Stenotrophomonas sp. 24(2023)]
MTTDDPDDIDALLRGQFAGPVADEGFSARVMQHLPPRRRTRWPLWAGAGLGVLACAVTLARAPLLRAGWGDWLAGAPSPAGAATWAIALAVAALVMAWGLAEAREA